MYPPDYTIGMSDSEADNSTDDAHFTPATDGDESSNDATSSGDADTDSKGKKRRGEKKGRKGKKGKKTKKGKGKSFMSRGMKLSNTDAEEEAETEDEQMRRDRKYDGVDTGTQKGKDGKRYDMYGIEKHDQHVGRRTAMKLRVALVQQGIGQRYKKWKCTCKRCQDWLKDKFAATIIKNAKASQAKMQTFYIRTCRNPKSF